MYRATKEYYGQFTTIYNFVLSKKHLNQNGNQFGEYEIEAVSCYVRATQDWRRKHEEWKLQRQLVLTLGIQR